MFNCNISMKFCDMSHFARSNGKKKLYKEHIVHCGTLLWKAGKCHHHLLKLNNQSLLLDLDFCSDCILVSTTLTLNRFESQLFIFNSISQLDSLLLVCPVVKSSSRSSLGYVTMRNYIYAQVSKVATQRNSSKQHTQITHHNSTQRNLFHCFHTMERTHIHRRPYLDC